MVLAVAVLCVTSHVMDPSSVLASLLLLLLALGGVWISWTYWRQAVPLRHALGQARPVPPWLPVVACLCSAHILAFLVGWLFVSLQLTRGPSMTPALRHRDAQVVWRSAYGLPRPFTEGYLIPGTAPAHGEVLTATYRGQLGLVKRVVGVPGDTVEVDRERVTVNGKLLQAGPSEASAFVALEKDADLGMTAATRQIPESAGGRRYWVLDQPGSSKPVAPHPRAFARRDRFPCTWHNEVLRCVVPAGQVFLMGDNRPVSADSRLLGTVPMSEVYGRTVLRIGWQAGKLTASAI